MHTFYVHMYYKKTCTKVANITGLRKKLQAQHFGSYFKGTVTSIPGPPCTDGNTRFLTVSLKALFNQVFIRY